MTIIRQLAEIFALYFEVEGMKAENQIKPYFRYKDFHEMAQQVRKIGGNKNDKNKESSKE